jgi:hypothetical protein
MGPSFRGVQYIVGHSTPLLRNCHREIGSVGGAHVTGGNAGELVRGGPGAGSHRARRLTGDIAEGAAEGAEALPPGLVGDLGDGEIGVAEERGGPLNPAAEEVAVRWHPEGLPERAGEVRLGDTAHAGQAVNRPGLVRRGVDAVLGPEQPAQQIGVLRAAGKPGPGSTAAHATRAHSGALLSVRSILRNLSTGARMRRLSLALILTLAPAVAGGQQSPAQAAGSPLQVGAVAPDFSLPGATRYGVLAKPVRLSDFKGKTVVLAFFYKARTSG